jgi:hypothetical protein
MDYEQIAIDLGFTPANKVAWLEINARYYEDPEQGWKDKLLMHAYPQRSAAVYVMPGYESPASGKWIETPSQRREDFKRTGTRPWEGRQAETQHNESIRQADEIKMDAAIDHSVRTAWQHLPDTTKQAALAESGV